VNVVAPSIGAQTDGVQTELDAVLNGLRQEFALLAQPLYIVVGQVMGLALLFVVGMASLLVAGEAGAIATLRSRGAGSLQLLGSYILPGVLVAALAVVLGPLGAAALSLALARLFVPAVGRVGRPL
jgi:hypothetical protein